MTVPLVHAIDRSSLTLRPPGVGSARHLSNLDGVFADAVARAALLADGDPLVYTVEAVEHREGSGALSYGLGVLQPGRVGEEYFMTKGHAHARREAAEVYLGVAGRGLMVLEDLRDGRAWTLPLEPDGVVVVPGYVAHRTVNVGDEPLAYLGLYPSDAGHDYAVIAEANLRLVVLAGPAGPEVVERADLTARGAVRRAERERSAS